MNKLMLQIILIPVMLVSLAAGAPVAYVDEMDLGSFSGTYGVEIPIHGVQLIRLIPDK